MTDSTQATPPSEVDWSLCTCPKRGPSAPTRPGSAIQVGHLPRCPYIAARCERDKRETEAHVAAGGKLNWAGEPVLPIVPRVANLLCCSSCLPGDQDPHCKEHSPVALWLKARLLEELGR